MVGRMPRAVGGHGRLPEKRTASARGSAGARWVILAWLLGWPAVLYQPVRCLIDDYRLHTSGTLAHVIRIGNVSGSRRFMNFEFDISYVTEDRTQYSRHIDLWPTMFQPDGNSQLIVRYDPSSPGQISTNWGADRLLSRTILAAFLFAGFVTPVAFVMIGAVWGSSMRYEHQAVGSRSAPVTEVRDSAPNRAVAPVSKVDHVETTVSTRGLRDAAVELSSALNQTLSVLLADQSENKVYAKRVAGRLEPLIADFDDALFEKRSRAQAGLAISSLTQCVEMVNVASTKGEMNFPFETAMATFARLQAIFRESRYRGQSL